MQSSHSWTSFLENSLANLEQSHRRRHRQVTEYLPGQRICHAGQQLINFGGNDYLGLRNHPKVVEAAIAALRTNGVGSGASPAVTGYSLAQQTLEQRLASFQCMPAALVFPSGFAGNMATLTSLVGDGDVIFSDALNHASLIDGCRLSRAAREIYPHNDVGYLQQRLASVRHQFQRALIVTESIFSMDGDAAALVELVELAERFDCGLVVDEAHATGIYGKSGAGLIEECALSNRVFAKLGTLSKAIGSLGGFVCGGQNLNEFVLNRGRAYMFSTALPSSVLSAATSAIDLVSTMHEARHRLRAMSVLLRQTLRSSGLHVLGVDSPIIAIVLGTEQAALELSGRLGAAGIFVPAIRPPTVPPGTSRLRISLSAEHTDIQLYQLQSALLELLC
jgi:8-amino-7-oxononanoate synthase